MSPLICEACGARDDTGTADGWRAFLGVEDDDSETVVVLCPFCAFDVLVHASPPPAGEETDYAR